MEETDKNKLLHHYNSVNQKKMERQIKRLERMREFYKSRIPDSPINQSMMFSGFVSALSYAISMMIMHKKLTDDLFSIESGEKNGKLENL